MGGKNGDGGKPGASAVKPFYVDEVRKGRLRPEKIFKIVPENCDASTAKSLYIGRG